MKVILSSDVDKLGRKGDVVDVARGFARNYLLPRKLAIEATKGSLRQADSMRKARDDKERKEVEAYEALASRIVAAKLSIPARAGEEGQLFGSVTTTDIAEALESALGEEIDRRKLNLEEPIRSVGSHDYRVHLHRDVTAVGTVEVTAAE